MESSNILPTTNITNNSSGINEFYIHLNRLLNVKNLY